MKRLFTTLIIGLTIIVLQGCGFHLRGKVALPASLSAVYIKSTDPALQTRVEEILRTSGTQTVTAEGSATAILRIFNVQYERIVRTVDTRGKATGYVLDYSVAFSVADQTGKTLLGTQSLRAQRDFNFDSTQVLVKESEENYLRQDMEQDVTQQMLRRLAAIHE